MTSKISVLISRNRRATEKRIRGYISEIFLYTTYPFRTKRYPKKKFVILSHPRTGSNMLVDMLDSHPMIHCDNEILINKLISPSRYIEHRTNLSEREVYGFKLQFHHLALQNINDTTGFIQALSRLGYKIIKLTRLNLYRAALSLMYAQNSGKFHYVSSDQSFLKVSIDPEELVERIKWEEDQVTMIDNSLSHIPHLHLVYEDHLLNEGMQQATANQVFDYLNLPVHKVKTKYIKMNSDDITRYIENAEEIRAIIRSTKYSYFLDSSR